MSVPEGVVGYEVRGGAAWATLNRPDARNALNFEVLQGISDALARAAEDPAVRSVVIAAEGPVFCAGADLKMVRAAGDGMADFLRRAAEVFDAVERHPKPVIAAVQGHTVAGGMELVLACDLVVAADTARLGDGHALYGMFPAAGGATRLPRRVGVNRAKHLLFTAETWDAERMREAGLVNEVVAPERLFAAVEELTATLARRSPLGLAGMKRVVEECRDLPLPEALAMELAASENYAHSADFAEGLTAFAERREPRFTGE